MLTFPDKPTKILPYRGAPLESFELIKKFVEEKPACSKALKYLKEGVEISVNIENHTPCSLFMDGGQPRLEQREAKEPDVEFVLFPEAIRRLSGHPGNQMSSLGVEIIREIVAGHIKVHTIRGVTPILTQGYLKIIAAAGPDFAKCLAGYGLNSITQMALLIKHLKK